MGGFLDLLSLILVIKGEILPEREGLRGEETETEETDFEARARLCARYTFKL